MTISASITARQIVQFTSPGTEIRVSQVGSTLSISSTLNGVVSTFSLPIPSGFVGVEVPAGTTLLIPASLAHAKAFSGQGTVVAQAALAGENISGLSLAVDRIELQAGSPYTLTAAQATIAGIGASGTAGNLVSSGVVTITAPTAADLSALVTDSNDRFILGTGGGYTLSAEQALRSTVGTSTAMGNLQAAGAVTVKASTGGDLSAIVLGSAGSVLELTAGLDYRLNSSQVSFARVGAQGTVGDMSNAGSVTVIASPTGEDLTARTATGIDILILAAGQAYTLTPEQARVARVGTDSRPADLLQAGAVTLKADAAGGDLTDIQLNSDDTLVLGAGLDYTLSSAQVARAKTGAAGALGNLQLAGQITLRANAAASSENLSAINVPGVDFFELTPGQNYTLSSSQAQRAKVGPSGTHGAFTTAGHVTVVAAAAGEDLTAAPFSGFSGVDAIQITPTAAYTLTLDQARKTRVDESGEFGRLAAAGNLTILSPTGADLTTLDTRDDVFVLGADQAYTLTTEQARKAKVGSDGVLGALAKTSSVVVRAASTGEDLSAWPVSGADIIELTAGQRYTLTPALASQARVGSAGVLGALATAGTVTVVANAASEMLNQTLSATGVDVIQLTAGGNYTLTYEQALISRVGSTGTTARLVDAGAVTVVATSAADFTRLTLGSGDTIQLATGQAYTLTNAQAAMARVGPTGSMGDLSSAGAVVILAATGADLSALRTDSNDRLDLVVGQNYILSTQQAAIARVGATGAPGNLVPAGRVTLVASDTGEDISSIPTAGVDEIRLTAGQNYTLTATQVALSRYGASGTPGQLEGTGVISVWAPMAADLTGIRLDQNDALRLQAAQNYTITREQALIARVAANGGPELPGRLDTAAQVTIRGAATGEDLSTLETAGVSGVDTYQLTPGAAYTLTASQAPLARMGTGGTLGNLTSSAQITVLAPQGGNLMGLTLDSGDHLRLSASQNYTLTAAQASIARMGTTEPAGVLRGSGVIEVHASVGGDYRNLELDAGDSLILTAGQRYALSTALAPLTRVSNGGALGPLGDLAAAGFVRLLAPGTGADVSTLPATGYDALQLSAGANYTLTSQQARLAHVGDAGAFGQLATAGNLTVISSAGEDLRALTLGDGDRLVLAAAGHYTLTRQQAAIAGVGNGPVQDLSQAGTVTLDASIGNDDLSNLNVTGLDEIILGTGRNYTLTPAQAAVSKVGPTGATGNLSKAGIVQIKVPDASPDFSDLSILGADAFLLTPGVNYTMSASQAMLSRMVTGGTSIGPFGQLTGTGLITVKAAQATDLSALTLDENDSIILWAGLNYTLTPQQAKIAAVFTPANGATPPSTGSRGDLASAGTIVVKASAAGENLSTLGLSGVDSYVLASGKNYTLTSAQAAIARVGTAAAGDLSKAGVVTVVANPTGESLSGLSATGIDALQLTDGAAYTLNATQAMVARIGNSGPGLLNGTGAITVVAPSSADLSAIRLDGGDTLILTANQNYTLTAQQAAIAKVGAQGTVGSLATAQTVTLKTAAGEDISGLTATGIDVITLVTGQNLTLTGAQIAMAKVGTGAAGNLTKAGVVNWRASTSGDILATTPGQGVDVLQLTASPVSGSIAYTLTPSGLPKKLQIDSSASASYQPLELAVATDRDASGDNLIGATNLGNGVANVIDVLGEWSFNTSTKVLRLYDGTSVVEVTLTGVNSILTDGSDSFGIV